MVESLEYVYEIWQRKVLSIEKNISEQNHLGGKTKGKTN